MCPAPAKSQARGRSSLIQRLKDSARKGELIAVVGTGVSVALTNNRLPALSWKGLIHDGFAYGIRKGRISEQQAQSWSGQLESSDLDDLLGAAEFLGRKLEAPHGDLYARWLEGVFKSVSPTNAAMKRAIRALHAGGIPISTLNYDGLLEATTGLQSINIAEKTKVAEWMRRDTSGVFHLHGTWNVPSSCVLGIRDYEAALGSEVRDLFQRSLGAFKRLIFIGCGDTFADPNFSALVKWLRAHLGTAAPEHIALVTDQDVRNRSADPAWLGFVEPLGYGPERSDLPHFLLEHFPPARTPRAKATKGTTRIAHHTAQHSKVLSSYRSFLLRDCGEMTIEGMRADMDTAQRRFDLERLFVPITVLPSAPEISASDPDREQKLLRWQKKNSTPRAFGRVFAKHKRIALLALPGGGKTLLLKRLAVAYADPARRKASVDGLPEVDLTPVLIRCRDWREHLHRPIATLLKSLPEITGQPNLEGLATALAPLFKQGRILLLVDGLDEVHDDAVRTTFVENLESFLRDNELTRVVVTSREAGFALVAPTLARFCQRWRMAPLAPDAVTALCSHWHRLMVGDSAEAQHEAREVADVLLRNESLRRLAENPLLLTMLLVVKHGAGRLPPDRVSLYSRAVEVLLDTWNIKGHTPLSPKEAVPQLAYVAFQLLRAGQQTATESELLALLDEARERVPQIRRYAKDSPHDFLKRVELRSSLVVEGGRQMENGRTVPFYQFRHLTFQEYLAAVAAAEGHYMDYGKSDTVLTPLESHLTAAEWKEVVPMSAVLARKQAEPLISALVSRGHALRRRVEVEGDSFLNSLEQDPPKIPAPVSRLVQCLVEEAEAAPETLTAALQLIAFFAKGCRSQDGWEALCRGPYGEELLHQAWLLYKSAPESGSGWLRNTCARFSALRRSHDEWRSMDGQTELLRLINSEHPEEIGLGLLSCCGLMLASLTRSDDPNAPAIPAVTEIERHVFREERELREPAIWGWVLARNLYAVANPTPAFLDRILSIWLSDLGKNTDGIAGLALTSVTGIPRDLWTPVLTDAQLEQIRQAGDSTAQEVASRYDVDASLAVAFYARNIWPDDILARRLEKAPRFTFRWAGNSKSPRDQMLADLRPKSVKPPRPSRTRRK